MDIQQIVKYNPRYSRFPWRTENQFRLLANADQFVPVMLDHIANANSYILFEMYLMESSNITTRFIDALLGAAGRDVLVYMILDDFGCLALKQQDRNRLIHKNIRVIYYNPLKWFNLKRYFFRDHRKLLLVDGRIALTGSAGITKENDPSISPYATWRDTMLEIKGPVIKDWISLFESVWNRESPEHLNLPLEPSIHYFQNHMYGRVISSRPIRTNTITGSIIRHGLKAKNIVWLVTAYFHPPRKLRRMLRKKARQKHEVRILLPGAKADHPSVWHFGHRHYARLLRAGVRIFEYEPRFMHTKIVLCDSWCSMGSSNFDRWEVPSNLEANQEIVNPEFAIQVRQMLEDDFSNSVEIQFESWNNRPWTRRIREWFWNQVGRFFVIRK